MKRRSQKPLLNIIKAMPPKALLKLLAKIFNERKQT